MKVVDTIESIKRFCKAKKGDCLSSLYINKRTKLTFICEKDHQWDTTWGSVKHRKTWCLICSGKSKGSIEEVKEYVNDRQGVLLSNTYINCEQKLDFQCNNGHIWSSSWALMKNNKSWCPYCYGNIKHDITLLQNFAKQKDGLLISTEYKGNHSKVIWQCNKGHQWEATWASIKCSNSWCPTCYSFKTESLCKTLLEQKLNILFTKTRFIYNNNRYEFDGYNEEHKIAFEYHGIQHYKYPNHWHKTEEIFNAAQQRDKDKEQYCIENGIRLIIIPYTCNSILETYINSLTI